MNSCYTGDHTAGQYPGLISRPSDDFLHRILAVPTTRQQRLSNRNLTLKALNRRRPILRLQNLQSNLLSMLYHSEHSKTRGNKTVQIQTRWLVWFYAVLRFYVLFNNISVISGGWKVDYESLCAMELRLRLRRFRLQRGSNSVSLISRPALNPMSYRGSCQQKEYEQK